MKYNVQESEPMAAFVNLAKVAQRAGGKSACGHTQAVSPVCKMIGSLGSKGNHVNEKRDTLIKYRHTSLSLCRGILEIGAP
jgi:hypothetical protein